jgi:hypothetical protein
MQLTYKIQVTLDVAFEHFKTTLKRERLTVMISLSFFLFLNQINSVFLYFD